MPAMSDAAAEFVDRVAAALADESFLALTLSQPTGDGAKQSVRPVTIGGQPRYQWTTHTRQQTHANRTAEETIAAVREALPSYRGGHLFTTAADWVLMRGRKGDTLRRAKPSKRPAATDHDRSKRRLLPEGEPLPFLVAAGLMTADGRIPKAKRAKYRQLNRFLELIDDIVPHLPDETARDGRPLHVVEFGSGQSHLSLAVRHLLADRHGQTVAIRAIDRDPGVIATARQRAGELGIDDITFEAAAIAEVELTPPVDLAIWLHACDTATDDALAKSVAAEAAVVLAVPCCQHEIAAAMRADADPLAAHGLLKERYAALATDALRANWLERHGYRTTVAEFVDFEHTAKNVLLRALRRTQPLSEDRIVALRREADDVKSRLGIAGWHLEPASP